MTRNNNESGNVFWIILVAVVLFAALGFAVTSTSRNTKFLTDEELALRTSEVAQFGVSVKTAMTRMGAWVRLDTGYIFAANGANATYGTLGNTSRYEVFGTQGGGAPYLRPPEGINDGTFYEFQGNYEVSGLGDTAGNATSTEIIMFLYSLTLDSCNMMNKKLGHTWSAPPVNTGTITTTRFAGTYTYTGTLTGASSELVGKQSFCFRESAGAQRYIYAHVLMYR